MTHKYPPEFAQALKRYADEESQSAGYKVSQPTVLMTLALSSEPRLRQLLREQQAKNSPKSLADRKN